MEIADYTIGEKFSEGSMAVLHRTLARDGLPLLLKTPRLGFGSHPACYAGFEVERLIMSRIGGVHVPRLDGSGETDAGPWLAFEEIAGPSLDEAVARAPLAAAEVARLGIAVATALHALHRQNVVHHDLTPAHVLFRASGEAVLIDFGLAHHGQLPDLVDDTDSGPLGTLAYISPEQLAGRRGDPRSDIFALGVILYRLATGKLPFGAPESLAGTRRRLYLDPQAPRRLNAEIPPWLQEVILGCLAVRPERRYATAAQIAHDLAHPEQVLISERGRRMQGQGWGKVLRRAWRTYFVTEPTLPPPAEYLAQAPHVLVAVDLDPRHEALTESLCRAVRLVLKTDAQWRVTCISVLESSMLTEQEAAPELTREAHTQTLIALHHWARGLALPPERVRVLVLQGSDPVDPLLDYARRHHVDLIVLGARGSSQIRRLMGSVSSRIAAEAPCSVTVVRN